MSDITRKISGISKKESRASGVEMEDLLGFPASTNAIALYQVAVKDSNLGQE